MESSVGNGGATGTVGGFLLRKVSSRSELSVESLTHSGSGESPTGVGSSLVGLCVRSRGRGHNWRVAGLGDT